MTWSFYHDLILSMLIFEYFMFNLVTLVNLHFQILKQYQIVKENVNLKES